MTSITPTEEKASPPPTYEQATYTTQMPPLSTNLGLYPTSEALFSSQTSTIGMSPTSMVTLPPQSPPVGICPAMAMTIPTQMPPAGTTMLINTRSLMYGDVPVHCICPHCYQTIITRVEKKDGLLPWLVCGGILLMGCWLGCCLIPFCIDGLKDTEHYCPHCAILLGARRRI